MQDTAAAERTDYFFRAGSWDYINIRPPHYFQFLSTYRSVRLQFVHLHGNAPIYVRVITTSVSLTAERSFRLQGTHMIPILFWRNSQSMFAFGPTPIIFFGPKLERIRINADRSPVRFFRTPSRSSYERAFEPEVFTSVFFNVCLVSHGLY